MKKLLAILVALGVVSLSLSAMAQAPAQKGQAPAQTQQAPAPAKPEAPAPAKPEAAKEEVKTVTGEVVAVDTKAKTLTVKSDTGELQISATAQQLKGIKKGVKVEVQYVEKEGKLIAKSIKKVKK
jgi:glucose/arabinose dehydrogenase